MTDIAPESRIIQSPVEELIAAGFPAYLCGFSAIDAYLGCASTGAVHILCGADLADLAHLFEGLRYPGVILADAALDLCGRIWYFRCEDCASESDLRRLRASFSFLEFYRDCATGAFIDPNGISPILRSVKETSAKGETAHSNNAAHSKDACGVLAEANPGADPCRAIVDGARILACYFPGTSSREISAIARELSAQGGGSHPCAEEQRLLLAELLNAPSPSLGFDLLKCAGFVGAYWPELAAMDDVDHSKEFHPEGNVWNHTMETLRYRKPAGKNSGFDLRLSLGLLLHDVGKPLSQSTASRPGANLRRPFDGHAELGETLARRFLRRLGFDAQIVRDVCYLVRNHMLPAALPRLPLFRTEEKMASPLFPLLMELYRCDESSSFKGLEGYYQSSAAFQSYLKHRRNPYRSADGKKAQGKR